MSYSTTTYAQAKTLLANRLGDPDKVFWTDEELGFYIKDALQHWSLLAQYWKDFDTFNTTSGQPFYKLSTQTDLRAYTLTDTDLIKIIQYHLMEPATGTSWTGSEQFSYQQVLDAIKRQRDKLLLETAAALQFDLVNSASPPVDHVQIDESVIDIRRVAWLPADGTYSTLRQRGPVSRRSFNPRAAYTPSIPTTYAKANQPYVSIELSPPANTSGQLHIITGRSKGSLDGQGTTLDVPDDFIPTLKWGVIADLLSSEKAADYARAEYAESRWQEGISAARLSPVLWSVRINEKDTSVTSLLELDSFRPNWQNTQGTPYSVAAAGSDLIALSPVPDDVYGLLVNVTRRPILPTLDSEWLQIGQEYIDILLDYCIHLACFKQGGDMFGSTGAQLSAFTSAAAAHNNRLQAQDLDTLSMSDQSSREERWRPRTEAALKAAKK